MKLSKGASFIFPANITCYTYRCLDWERNSHSTIERIKQYNFLIHYIREYDNEEWVYFDCTLDNCNPYMVKLKDFKEIFNIKDEQYELY